MNRESSTSIQRQLQIFFVLTLGFTVLVMGGVWIGHNQVLLEREAERVLIVEGDIIGAAARPAMMFNDQRMAAELLQSMQFDPDISMVKLFTYDGQSLFTYAAEDDTAARVQPVNFQQLQSIDFSDGRLRLYRVVKHKGEAVGVIYLESRLDHLKESQRTGYITVLMVMLGSLFLGLMLASRLQKRIASPISALAELMRKMGHDRDYSLRADSPTYNRETEELLVGFNQMADEIENSFHTIKENHRDLKEGEVRFRNVVELAPMPVVISRPADGEILLFNGAAAQMFGFEGKQSEDTKTLKFYRQPEDRQELLGTLKQEGKVVGKEIEAVDSNGDPFWVSLSMSRITFESEPALFTAFMDISDQKSIEKRLEEQVSERTSELKNTRDELQSTLDNMLDTYYRLSSDGAVVWASSAVHSLLGYSLEEVTGMPMKALWLDSCGFAQSVAALRENSGVLMNYKIQLKHRDGQLIWCSLSAHLIIDQQGEVVGIEGVVRDISLQVEAETQKQEMEKKMAHVQRLESLGVLAGGIAHDFNNILAGIMGNAELAEMNMKESLPADRELENIVSSSVRAADLCRQMLAYSGQGSLVRKAVNLSGLVEETVQLIDVSISKNVSLKFDLQAHLPSILADNTQIQQIIMNLITNASEAIGEQHGGEIHVVTGSIFAGREALDSPFLEERRPPGDYVFLEVTDNGCGMDEATLNRIFDPFFTTKFTGRGLGMSAMLGIVRSHDGALQVESAPEKGARFRVLFPVSSASVDDMQAGEIATEKLKLSDQELTVLVIDDEVMVRAIFEKMLKKMGCEVLLACDGEEGLQRYSEHQQRIDAVLLDMTMPRMGGKEALIRLREMGIKAPVIVCSGYRNENVIPQFEQVQPEAFLQKPFSLQSLHSVLRQCLANITGSEQ
ncbi:PAS domain S-box protein [Mariprofundus sp. NF]|uniref:PAS domain S-box protein n=1 Tax=Mariprofundus sp. NF TaxID=2608716 RepID=UPI0015A16590|nr:PAS domain S-box protein [Mariprofundus sp. NF]NWF37759.1 PAS domain S-box protein [Mariprofundus sp. NF]